MTEKSQKTTSAKVKAKSGGAKVFYHQKFRQEWKSNPLLKDWVREDENNRNRAFCRYCKCNLLSKYCDLITHSKTNKHLKAEKLFTSGQDNENTTNIKRISSISSSNLSVHNAHNNVYEIESIKGNDIKGDLSQYGAIKLSSEILSDDGDCLIDYATQSGDEEEIVHMVAEDDNDILINTNFGASKILIEERVRAETEYFNKKALYFSKLAENSRIQRTLMVLQSRKLHLELQKLQNEL